MAGPLAVSLAPIRGKARIDVLDILRGLAILGIFYINVPYMAAQVWQFSAAMISTIGIVLLVLFAHAWMWRFTNGPLEWLWRSLAYVRWQPLLRTRLNAPPRTDRAFRPAPRGGGGSAPAER